MCATRTCAVAARYYVPNTTSHVGIDWKEAGRVLFAKLEYGLVWNHLLIYCVNSELQYVTVGS